MGSETYQGMSTILIIASIIVRRIAPNIATPYPIFMKSMVGRTLKITLSISSPSSERFSRKLLGVPVACLEAWPPGPRIFAAHKARRSDRAADCIAARCAGHIPEFLSKEECASHTFPLRPRRRYIQPERD